MKDQYYNVMWNYNKFNEPIDSRTKDYIMYMKN